MSEQRTFPAPITNIENHPFYEGTAGGKYLVKHCTECNQYHFYPRAICPHCFSSNTQWKESTGTGEIYSFSVMRRVPQPYAIAYVKLDEGITVMTNIVDADPDLLKIGQKVHVVFRESDGDVTIPAFVLS